MEIKDLEELLALEKKLYMKLNETTDLTRELAESVDRQDQVSVHMLLSLREKPVLELQEIEACIELKRVDLTARDAQRFDELLAGADGVGPDECDVATQVAINRRTLGRLVELDERINRKLCGRGSCYEK